MPNIEERLQTLEQEHATLKKTIELQTIAIGALVNKATLEKLNEKYDRLFETLITHDHFTNEQLAELRAQQIEEDGKIVGLQTEMRQRFAEQNDKVTELDNKVTELDNKVASLQTEVYQRFAEQNDKIVGLQTEVRQRFAEHTTLLQQILARLPA